MDSVYKTDVKMDSSVRQTSDIDFQQKDKYNVIKSILEAHDDDKEVVVAEYAGSLEIKQFQAIETEEESKDVRNVTSSPKAKQNVIKNGLAEHILTSNEFSHEYDDKCSQELNKSDNNLESQDNVYIPSSGYHRLKSPNYKEDEEAYFECNEAVKLFEESDHSSSNSSLSSCDASFSHSEDENDDTKKGSIQSTSSNGIAYEYNGLLQNAKMPAPETKLTSENILMKENNKEISVSPNQNDIKTANEVFLQKSAEMGNQVSLTNDEDKNRSYSQNGAESVKSCNKAAALHKPRSAMATKSDKRSKDKAAGSANCKSTDNIAFVMQNEEKTTYKTTFHKSHSLMAINPAKTFRNATENMEFIKPDEETAAKIMNRVEFYFTDFNILKNNFLLKHTRKNKEGYISLKLVTSFRKVKAITKDWRVVAYSLANSKVLKLNSEKTKVRRIEPIPKIEDTSFGKTVLVFNLPFQNPFSEQLKELFGKFGNVVYAEIMTTKSKNYNLYHKKCLFFNRDIATATFGVIEFENYKDALSALKDEDGYLPKENEMTVVPLVAKYYRFKPKTSFRYKSTISYPKMSYGKYYPKSEYPPDIYAVNEPNGNQYGKYYHYNQQAPRNNYAYGANYGYYSHQSDPRNYYSKQNMVANNYSTSKFPSKNSNNNGKYSEYRRQNRHLKANTSMNIDKRLASADRKNGAN